MTFRFNSDADPEDFAGLRVPIRDEEHDTSGMMLMLNDVTALKRSQEEALAASRAKSLFLSNTSHEIRTPTNAIIGMTTNVFKEDIEKCLKADMDNHQGKPIVPKAVIAMMAQYFKDRCAVPSGTVFCRA